MAADDIMFWAGLDRGWGQPGRWANGRGLQEDAQEAFGSGQVSCSIRRTQLAEGSSDDTLAATQSRSDADMVQDTRKDSRAKVLAMTVRYKSATIDEFIEYHSHDVSRGGIFIKTPSPFPPGTLLKFEIRIAEDTFIIGGVGRVVWKRDNAQSTAERPAGMGVKFLKIDESSRKLIDRIVDLRGDAPSAFDESASIPGKEEPSDKPVVPAPLKEPVKSQKVTMLGLGTTDIPGLFPAELEKKEEAPTFFPKSDGDDELPPPEERTVMKQAAELLAEALKGAGGSMEEIGAASQHSQHSQHSQQESDRQEEKAAPVVPAVALSDVGSSDVKSSDENLLDGEPDAIRSDDAFLPDGQADTSAESEAKSSAADFPSNKAKGTGEEPDEDDADAEADAEADAKADAETGDEAYSAAEDKHDGKTGAKVATSAAVSAPMDTGSLSAPPRKLQAVVAEPPMPKEESEGGTTRFWIAVAVVIAVLVGVYVILSQCNESENQGTDTNTPSSTVPRPERPASAIDLKVDEAKPTDPTPPASPAAEDEPPAEPAAPSAAPSEEPTQAATPTIQPVLTPRPVVTFAPRLPATQPLSLPTTPPSATSPATTPPADPVNPQAN